MPPKKTKIWNVSERGNIMMDAGIIFKGPVQPSEWPQRHKHLFKVIRGIWGLRYEDYKKSHRLTQHALRKRREMAVEISRDAQEKRSFVSTNEPTWRAIETKIMIRFSDKALCEVCEKDKFKFEHEADLAPWLDSSKLGEKREGRKLCMCDQGDGSIASEPEDSERGEFEPRMFNMVQSKKMTHDPGDNFEHTGIPMEPDLTVGLKGSPQMRQALRASQSTFSHCPIQNETNMLYPFLLIEAKRDQNAPGFTSVEAQTAFPIRRLLKLQDRLGKESKRKFDPLVWFFAYQGEEWRLYAGTLKEERVQVYDIWHGNLESYDGSLQMLQIVDYIWTWARDIFRPRIRKCLRALVPGSREVSPLTESTVSRSGSVLSDLRLQASHQPQIDVVMENEQDEAQPTTPTEASARPHRIHRLLQYSVRSDQQDKFTLATIRHSEVIAYDFRIIYCPTRAQALESPHIKTAYVETWKHCALLMRSNSILPLNHGGIIEVQKWWTGNEATPVGISVQTAGPEERRMVCFYIHTYYRPGDWQIVRELNCVIWDAAELGQLGVNWATENNWPSASRRSSLIQMFSQVRSISGRASAWYALRDIRLLLSTISKSSRRMRWAANDSSMFSEFESRAEKGLLGSELHCQSPDSELVVLEPTVEQVGGIEGLVPVPGEMGEAGGILVKKPQNWPLQSPRFCLIVWLDIAEDDRHRLKEVLREVLDRREFYGAISARSGQEELTINEQDRTLIRKWLQSFDH